MYAAPAGLKPAHEEALRALFAAAQSGEGPFQAAIAAACPLPELAVRAGLMRLLAWVGC